MPSRPNQLWHVGRRSQKIVEKNLPRRMVSQRKAIVRQDLRAAVDCQRTAFRELHLCHHLAKATEQVGRIMRPGGSLRVVLNAGRES